MAAAVVDLPYQEHDVPLACGRAVHKGLHTWHACTAICSHVRLYQAAFSEACQSRASSRRGNMAFHSAFHCQYMVACEFYVFHLLNAMLAG